MFYLVAPAWQVADLRAVPVALVSRSLQRFCASQQASQVVSSGHHGWQEEEGWQEGQEEGCVMRVRVPVPQRLPYSTLLAPHGLRSRAHALMCPCSLVRLQMTPPTMGPTWQTTLSPWPRRLRCRTMHCGESSVRVVGLRTVWRDGAAGRDRSAYLTPCGRTRLLLRQLSAVSPPSRR